MVFKTNLSSAEFARQKLSFLLVEKGAVVQESEGGFRYAPWQAESAREEASGMTIYGKGEGGERLLDAISADDKNRAIDALLLWERAARFLLTEQSALYGGITAQPSFVMLDHEKRALFFPPRSFSKFMGDNLPFKESTLLFEHPSLEGSAALNWSLAAALYYVFSGLPPFTTPLNQSIAKKNALAMEDEVRQSQRAGLLLPAHLAAPGLRPETASFINALLSAKPDTERETPFIESVYEKNFTPLTEKEKDALFHERERVGRRNKKMAAVKKFWARRRSALLIAAGTVITSFFIAGNVVKTNLERWSTKGLTALDVVLSYYGAFNTLDHEVISACAIKKANDAVKNDESMITNIFVMARMREAYERRRTVISPFEAGGGVTEDTMIFGIIDLDAALQIETGGSAIVKAKYNLVLPRTFIDNSGSNAPTELAHEDTVTLAWFKDRWKITGIDRR